MTVDQRQKHKRTADPYMDRRTGEDRRLIHRIGYFAKGGTESRNETERRDIQERRKECIRVSRWSSVCIEPPHHTSDHRKK